MLTKDEYQHWVDFAHDNYYGMPKILYQDESQFMHRATLAKQLMRLKEYAPAIELFKTIVNVEIDELDSDFGDVLEQKVWCLQELAIAIWKVTSNVEEALKYAEVAWKLADETSFMFCHVVKAEIWRDRLEFLNLSGKTEQALKEADEMISKTIVEQGKNNSFLAYAYHFKASLAKAEGDIEQAVDYLKQAVTYTLSAEEMEELLESMRQQWVNDPEVAFKELESSVFESNIFWYNEKEISE